MSELAILFEPDPSGPEAIISPDGQALWLNDRKRGNIAATEIAAVITSYLVKERLASGTVVGPRELQLQVAEPPEFMTVSGSSFDMNYHAGFADLLVGWWDNGIIAHQGSSCFGDAVLTAIYYLEALRSNGQ